MVSHRHDAHAESFRDGITHPPHVDGGDASSVGTSHFDGRGAATARALQATLASAPPRFLGAAELDSALRSLDRVLYAVRHDGEVRLSETMPDARHLAGVVPAIGLEDLGSRGFREAHGVRYAYVTGAMAGGIASIDLVVAMAKAGFMGFFGAGAVPLPRLEEAILEVKRRLPAGEPFGFNLLHNHFEPRLEMDTVELYLKHGVRTVEAAAFMQLTPALVYFRAKGLRMLPDGRVRTLNRVFAKISRPEVAAQFLAPAPENVLRELVAAGKLIPEEARIAALVPVAEDITAEADSGGHTDQRPFPVLLPLMLRERDAAMERYGYKQRGVQVRVGAAGGIGEPMSAHAALSLGADYLLTGSVNQACLESGTSEIVKRMLAEADMADVVMAPAPDMFELGARVQVLRRGTLWPQRAQKLYDLYRGYNAFEEIPEAEREKVEKQILQRPFAEVWADTEKYWQGRDPAVAEKGRQDGKQRMALCFRWYLGMASRWAVSGDPARRLDYQIWCGASIGALNRWAKGSWIEKLENRDAAAVGAAILHGAAVLARREAAARAGVEALPTSSDVSRPATREELPAATRRA